MGCNVSKLEDDEEMPAGQHPFRGRIKEMKRRRRVRNVSIISTTELLRPEDIDDECVKKVIIRKAVDDECVEKVIIKKAIHDECVKKTIFKKEEALEEEFPRSPSFRVYFLEAAAARDSDDDSDKAIQKIKDAKLAQEKVTTQVKEFEVTVNEHGRENSHDCLISIEDSVNKPNKKEKWRKFKTLTKAQNHVYSFLTMKNRHGPNYTSDTKSEQNLDHPTQKST